MRYDMTLEEYNLSLDKDGCIDICFANQDSRWKSLLKINLIEMIDQSSKIRHDI